MRLAMQHGFVLLGVSVLVVLLAGAAFAADRLVAISGTGEVLAAPDEVAIALGMKAVDDDLKRVRATNDQQLTTIVELAQKHGVKVESLKVGRMGLALTHDSQLRRPIYHVDRSVEFRLGNLANLNPLLIELLKQPDTQVNSIVFTTGKEKDYEKEARAKAMADAREKAQQLAELSQLRLGKARRITTVSEAPRSFAASMAPLAAPAPAEPLPVPAPSALPQKSTPNGRFIPVVLADEKPADAAFGLGKVGFTVTVHVEFELE